MDDVQNTCDEIRSLYRENRFAMEVRKRVNNQLGAFLRTSLGWGDLDKSEDERDAIADRAAELISVGEKVYKRDQRDSKKAVPGEDDPVFLQFKSIILTTVLARSEFDRLESEREKRMVALAKRLPAYAWVESIPGFGALGFAGIIGNSGNLSGYSNPAKLWKRMGLAVMDGTRQGGLPKSASADEWIEHGYSKKRRSAMYLVGLGLVNMNKDADGGPGMYRSIYNERKAFERAKAEAAGLQVLPAARITKAKADKCISDGQVEKRARRYMEKTLLRHLWREWRRCAGVVEPEVAYMEAAE